MPAYQAPRRDRDTVKPIFQDSASDLSACADEALTRRVEAMLSAGPWRQHCAIGVTVRDAVVTLDGTCWDDGCLDTVAQAVMGVAYVRAVDNRLAWVLPDCGIGSARRN
jgi:osmotically-inducible protein OsmY